MAHWEYQFERLKVDSDRQMKKAEELLAEYDAEGWEVVGITMETGMQRPRDRTSEACSQPMTIIRYLLTARS
jgi:hypothetical protein